jgi:hypothetical protein
MNKKEFTLKIYCFSNPLVMTEWRTLLGDKYAHALPFNIALTERIEDAAVIAWDGVISIKMRSVMEELRSHLKKGKVLLLMGEGSTLFKDFPMVENFLPDPEWTVLSPGWSTLPEELLASLETCYQKIQHV